MQRHDFFTTIVQVLSRSEKLFEQAQNLISKVHRIAVMFVLGTRGSMFCPSIIVLSVSYSCFFLAFGLFYPCSLRLSPFPPSLPSASIYRRLSTSCVTPSILYTTSQSLRGRSYNIASMLRTGYAKVHKRHAVIKEQQLRPCLITS